jgi:hypothetical protein
MLPNTFLLLEKRASSKVFMVLLIFRKAKKVSSDI